MRNGSKDRTEDKTDKIIIVQAGIFILVLIGIFLLSRTTQIGLIIHRFEEWVENQGNLTPLAYLVLWIAAAIFMLPGAPIAILAGPLFGPFFGTIYVSLFSTIGACTALLIGKYIHGRWVERLIQRSNRIRRLKPRNINHDWKLLAFLRLVPIFPYNLVNYWFAITGIHLYTFAVVSFLCLIPTSAMYVILGVGLFDLAKRERFYWAYLLSGLILIVILLGIYWLVSRYKRRT